MKMGIKRCKLSRKIQAELLQFFIAEVTARTAATRTAANLVDINRHTATLYYHKIREVISYHLEQDSHYEFDGDQKCGEANWSWTRAILLINFIWFLLKFLFHFIFL